ncbi:MAG: phosphoribosylaminoimidazolesuccinocarboxamide synthase [Candidatus Altiarchaeota archaeon]
MAVVLETALPAKLKSRGKVRDVYDLSDHLLIVATDRISAFDSILPNGIPLKGEVLNKLSAYWFQSTKGIVENHMLSIDVDALPEELQRHKAILEGRSMLVERARPLPVECVARGYLSGSGWKEYQRSGRICGIRLPGGLVESDRLPEPIFTPTTKAETGHDLNITFEDVVRLIGGENAHKIREHTLELYESARKSVEGKGIIIADTKFEFGLKDGELLLIDEALTPDSSRFWPMDQYRPGGPQRSYDKQYVRDYLERIKWDKEPPAPKLPDDVVKETSRKYVEAYEKITGRRL